MYIVLPFFNLRNLKNLQNLCTIYIYVGDERTPELLLGFAGIPQLCNLD